MKDQLYQRVRADTRKYPETNAETANLLLKEVQATDLRVYFDPSGHTILPTKLMEKAE